MVVERALRVGLSRSTCWWASSEPVTTQGSGDSAGGTGTPVAR